jgi:hypothetical protein
MWRKAAPEGTSGRSDCATNPVFVVTTGRVCKARKIVCSAKRPVLPPEERSSSCASTWKRSQTDWGSFSGTYVHLQPNVPAAVLPLGIKPPVIPLSFLMLAAGDLVMHARLRLERRRAGTLMESRHEWGA